MTIPQYDAGRWVGAAKAQFGRVQFYSSSVLLVFSMIAARPQIQVWFPWLNYWFVFAGVALGYFAGMVFDYVFVLKAETEFNVSQSLKHKNESMELLKESVAIEREAVAILRRLDATKTEKQG